MTKQYADFDAAERYAPCLERASTSEHGWVAEMEQAQDGNWVSIQSVQGVIDKLRAELRECRHHLSEVMALPSGPTIKAAADWLADWDGKRIDPGEADEPEQTP